MPQMTASTARLWMARSRRLAEVKVDSLVEAGCVFIATPFSINRSCRRLPLSAPPFSSVLFGSPVGLRCQACDLRFVPVSGGSPVGLRCQACDLRFARKHKNDPALTENRKSQAWHRAPVARIGHCPPPYLSPPSLTAAASRLTLATAAAALWSTLRTAAAPARLAGRAAGTVWSALRSPARAGFARSTASSQTRVVPGRSATDIRPTPGGSATRALPNSAGADIGHAFGTATPSEVTVRRIRTGCIGQTAGSAPAPTGHVRMRIHPFPTNGGLAVQIGSIRRGVAADYVSVDVDLAIAVVDIHIAVNIHIAPVDAYPATTAPPVVVDSLSTVVPVVVEPRADRQPRAKRDERRRDYLASRRSAFNINDLRVVLRHIDHLRLRRFNSDNLALGDHFLLRGSLKVTGSAGLGAQFLDRVANFVRFRDVSLPECCRPFGILYHHVQHLRIMCDRLDAHIPVLVGDQVVV